jgi:hypothetical protein
VIRGEDYRDLTALEPQVDRPGTSAIATTTCAVSVASATSMTVIPGIARIRATSSIAWTLGPPGPAGDASAAQAAVLRHHEVMLEHLGR